MDNLILLTMVFVCNYVRAFSELGWGCLFGSQLTLTKVLGDGNCLFQALCLCLDNIGVKMSMQGLRDLASEWLATVGVTDCTSGIETGLWETALGKGLNIPVETPVLARLVNCVPSQRNDLDAAWAQFLTNVQNNAMKDMDIQNLQRTLNDNAASVRAALDREGYNLASHAICIKMDKVWGRHWCLEAIAAKLNVVINLYMSKSRTTYGCEKDKGRKEINLAFNGRDHYDACKNNWLFCLLF